jgi:hypothetical protein
MQKFSYNFANFIPSQPATKNENEKIAIPNKKP